MSAEFGIALAIVTLGSCFASYKLGQLNIIARYEEYARRRREKELRWEEFDDED
jgi:hypothetical protein